MKLRSYELGLAALQVSEYAFKKRRFTNCQAHMGKETVHQALRSRADLCVEYAVGML